MVRIIGIRHRVKQTAEGEARPTMVAIKDGSEGKYYELSLSDENAELDFVVGRFPVAYRVIDEGEDISKFPPHHIKRRKQDDMEKISVPAEYDGLSSGDRVVMVLGGSGDRLAYALSRRGEEIIADVVRIPPSVFKRFRKSECREIEDDHKTLVAFAEQSHTFTLYHPITVRDRDLIKTQEAFRARKDAQKDRIACEQRLRQRFIGRIFLSDSGYYPEGSIEDEYDKMKATDIILRNLIGEEKEREKELRKAVNELNVWHAIFSPIKGCGEVIAAGIITPIGNILRFPTDAKLKKFAGVHVLEDGRFARKRIGIVANWNPQLRQALYLLGDQFNRNPNSVWGQKLREYKVKFREKHPEVVENGKKKYSNGHIHKMATWRTLTKFVEWLHKEWTRIEQVASK